MRLHTFFYMQTLWTSFSYLNAYIFILHLFLFHFSIPAHGKIQCANGGLGSVVPATVLCGRCAQPALSSTLHWRHGGPPAGAGAARGHAHLRGTFAWSAHLRDNG